MFILIFEIYLYTIYFIYSSRYHRLLFNHNIIILSGNCHIRVLSRQCSNRGNKSKMQHWKWISDTT